MQRKACHSFAAKMGWTIVHEEQEEGVSGHKVRAESRDKLQIIKSMAARGEFDIFLVFMFDRTVIPESRQNVTAPPDTPCICWMISWIR